MKFLVLTILCVCVYQTVAVSTEVKTKMSPKGNAIPAPPKTEFYYPQVNQQSQQDFMPMHVIQKPMLFHQGQPQTAMIIIAQPAYVPQNVIYGNQAAMQQQLLNYFHGNPQAKYQFLFGGYQPHPTAQPYIPQHQLPAQTVPAYQIVPNPVFNGYNHVQAAPPQMAYNHVQAAPPQMAYNQVQTYQQNQVTPQYVQPMQLNQLAHLAQLAAQQYNNPLRSAPPIITGLENFSPEHQAQIKAQIGSHVAVPLSASTATTPPATTTQYTAQPATQITQSGNSQDYMQNQDKQNPQGSASTFSPSLVYRAQYTKG